jgi:hypothetical protein
VSGLLHAAAAVSPRTEAWLDQAAGLDAAGRIRNLLPVQEIDHPFFFEFMAQSVLIELSLFPTEFHKKCKSSASFCCPENVFFFLVKYARYTRFKH